MIVFRITLLKYSDKLHASGNAARWNSKDVKMIYTAGSRALACLENVVHRSSRGLQENFRTLLIEIPENLKIGIMNKTDLLGNWRDYASIPYTQKFGDKWVRSKTSPVLQVPSAIIPQEFNYLLNPLHKDFHKIKLINTESFEFDGRLKAD